MYASVHKKINSYDMCNDYLSCGDQDHCIRTITSLKNDKKLRLCKERSSLKGKLGWHNIKPL